jgi:Zn-dependent protease
MLPRALRLVTIRGIDVRLDPWLVPLALLLVWTLARRVAPVPSVLGIVVALAVTLGLFASILVHELGHAFEARHRGLEVRGVTLLLLGGATEIHGHGRSARDDLAVAAIGPWMSLTLAGLFGLVATGASEWFPVGIARPVSAVAGVLGWANLALALFNLIPGAPLDGGRVLRALVWMATGDRARASRWSTRAGQMLGGVLVVIGVAIIVLAPGRLVDAAWASIVGVFLVNAATLESRQEALRARLEATPIPVLLGARQAPLDGERPLALVDDAALAATLVVPVSREGRIVGRVVLADVTAMHPSDRALRHAIDIMVPLDDVVRVAIEADALTLVEAVGLGADPVALTDGEASDAAVVDVVDRATVLAAVTALSRSERGVLPRRRSPRASRRTGRTTP